MINENRLDEILKYGVSEEVTNKEGRELIRLARLGLWAEKHGVSALRCEDPIVGVRRYEGCDVCDACKALAALPKESK